MSTEKKTKTKFFSRHKHAGRRFQRKKWDDGEGERDAIKKHRVTIQADVRLDIDHATNIMCLHYGLSRSSLVNHALAQLWQDVYQEIRPKDLIKYDQRVKEYTLFNAYKDARNRRKVKQYHTKMPSKEQIAEAKSALEEDLKQHLLDPSRKSDEETKE